MTDKLLILTTTESKSEAEKIAQALVERRLAACVNVIPQIRSIYRWKDKVESAEEFLLLIKTTEENESAVQAAIRELHSYDLPECISILIDGGSAEYLKWIAESL